MVYVAPVQTFDYERARIPEVFAHFQSFFVYVFSGEVFSHTAVIRVAQFSAVNSVVEKVVNIHVIHIALDFVQVHLVLRGVRLVFIVIIL